MGICAWHSIWNWAQYNVYGFAVSGMTIYSTPLFKPATNGPEFLHGGSFGIEGSIITTIMLTIASIVLWRKLWEEKRNNEILVNERGETMGIIAFEGASAVGKSTTCRELEKNYGAYIIPEVNSLFERPKMNIEHGILKNKLSAGI